MPMTHAQPDPAPRGPDSDTQRQLHAWGAAAAMPEVSAFYAPRLAAQDRSGVILEADLPYGTHERHRLDVYRPAEGGGQRPVLVFFHGGGFIRGDKRDRANVGWWGAREGFVTVLANYRLAPQVQWPAGGQDVAAVWQWLQREAAAFGGDPAQIVLAGESAGAAHVATACLLRRVQPGGWNPAGAALLSGPYDAGLEGRAAQALGIAQPDIRNEAYFGPDRAGWAAASITGQVDAAPLPLLITMAERDLLQMQVQAGALFARLVNVHGFSPEFRLVREHNHFSIGFSIGTDDDSVSAPLAAFVRRCGG